MISPAKMKIIQIDITNACVHTCSNCTRFCGHHKDVFFMDFPTFKNAVDSLDGYSGIVGMIGGEPTIHPQFEEFADYIRTKRVREKVQHMRQPQPDMLQYIHDHMWNEDAPVGLWSSLNKGYYKHFEVINDTFRTQLLNDHDNACLHQALLMPRKELGISDEEWREKRHNCWIQNTWSATITPKGAFFCEVAGSLDMLFHGSGGWAVEPGWWKRNPEDFTDQLHWCELCSGCLDVPKRISNDGRDDITPGMLQKLSELHSPKIDKKMYVVLDPENYDKTLYQTFTGANDYMDAGDNQRTSVENRNLYPKKFVIVSAKDLGELLYSKEAKDWILVANDLDEAQEAQEYFQDVIINPGCIYIYGNVIAMNIKARSLRWVIQGSEPLCEDLTSHYPSDKVVFIDSGKARHDRDWVTMQKISHAIDRGGNIAIYGAGDQGRKDFLYFFSRYRGHIAAWVDRDYKRLGYPVKKPDILTETSFDYVVVAIESRRSYREVRDYLLEREIALEKILWLPDMQLLQNESNYIYWFDKLKDATKQYLVVLTVKDTPGSAMPAGILNNIIDAGFTQFRTDLWCTYIGVISSGHVMVQQFHENGIRSDYVYASPDQSFNLRATSQAWKKGNRGDIQINGQDYSVNMRGVNIVIWDIRTKHLVDSIGFDSHDVGMTNFRHLR